MKEIDMYTILPIYENETFFSWISRMYYFQDNCKNSNFLYELFASKAKLSMYIPAHLDHFINYIGDTKIKKLRTCDSILDEMTIFPFYSMFWNEYERNEFIIKVKKDSFSSECQNYLHMKQNGTALFLERYYIKLCPECMNEDYKKFGIIYIHREHTVIRNVFCHIHKIRLKFIYKEDNIKSGFIRITLNDKKKLLDFNDNYFIKDTNTSLRISELIYMTLNRYFNGISYKQIEELLNERRYNKVVYSENRKYNPHYVFESIAELFTDLNLFYSYISELKQTDLIKR